jgi:hypothetical protein
MMKGKCNCGKKATGEYLVRNKKTAWTIKLCDDCKPKLKYPELTLIYGK